ncbi:uncharacterized protein [Periplaneta americana]|uniref:uncharacterized protein isoform X5 n=1 Tax=Periplaneta americana TaxID=6978 RepID=UPI0037E80C2F
MSEYEQCTSIKFCVTLGNTEEETTQLMKIAYREQCMAQNLIQEWYRRFKERKCSEDDEQEGKVRNDLTRNREKRRHNTRGRMSSKKQRADTESDTSSETSKEEDENEMEFGAHQGEMTVSNSSEEAAIGDPICKTEVTVSNSSEDAPFCAAVCKTEMTVSNSSEDAPFCASVCKTEVHILDDVTIKTELTDETYAESQNCILGDLVPKQETPKCE